MQACLLSRNKIISASISDIFLIKNTANQTLNIEIISACASVTHRRYLQCYSATAKLGLPMAFHQQEMHSNAHTSGKAEAHSSPGPGILQHTISRSTHPTGQRSHSWDNTLPGNAPLPLGVIERQERNGPPSPCLLGFMHFCWKRYIRIKPSLIGS